MAYAEVEIEDVTAVALRRDMTIREWQKARAAVRERGDRVDLVPIRCLGTGELLDPDDQTVLVLASGMCPNFATSKGVIDRHLLGPVVLGAINRMRAIAGPLLELVECDIVRTGDLQSIGLPTKLLPQLVPPPSYQPVPAP